jgi:DnaK suppressor protein
MATKDILEPSLEVLGITPYKQLKKGEEYMDSKMREHFRNILTLLRKQIMEEADRTVTHMKDEAVNYPDPNDRASQEEEFRLELRARDRERRLLKKIEESLQLLINKEYGYCEVCGIEIGLRRLEARPTATLCIDCKTLDEIKEKQGG